MKCFICGLKVKKSQRKTIKLMGHYRISRAVVHKRGCPKDERKNG